jgi:tetratricopeptide (TPR) repeat protein
MRNTSVPGFVAYAALLAVLSFAQEQSTAQKIARPDPPAATPAALNSTTDVLAVGQPLAAPASTRQSVTPSKPKGPVNPTIEIPDELKSKVNIAAQKARANQAAEALALYTEILTASPNLFTVAVERGKLYQQVKDHANAIADFSTAINFRPMEYFEAYFHRCISYYESGDHAKAIPDCSKAIEINPGAAEYYYYRGLAYTALRTWDKAAADLAAANERNNDNADSHLQLARIYFEMDKLVGSLREYTVAIQKRPGFMEAYKGRSVVKAALGDATGSQEDSSKAAR